MKLHGTALGQAAGGDLEGGSSKIALRDARVWPDVAVVEVDKEDASLTDILRPRRSRNANGTRDDVDSALLVGGALRPGNQVVSDVGGGHVFRAGLPGWRTLFGEEPNRDEAVR